MFAFVTVWVVKVGPLNQFNQYDYAIISNWVRFPVFVIARDPEVFQKYYMKEVLQYLEQHSEYFVKIPPLKSITHLQTTLTS